MRRRVVASAPPADRPDDTVTAVWERISTAVARRHGGTLGFDEARQVALIACWEATRRYDPERGTLATWCYRRARWKVLTETAAAVRARPLELVEGGGPWEAVADLDLEAVAAGTIERESQLLDLIDAACGAGVDHARNRAICHLLALGHRKGAIAETLNLTPSALAHRVQAMRARVVRSGACALRSGCGTLPTMGRPAA